MAIISASLLFLPAITGCCPLYVWGIYVIAWPLAVKPCDESQRHNEAGSAQPVLHGLLDEAMARSHESQSKSDNFMLIIGLLATCSAAANKAVYHAPPPINRAASTCCLKATCALLIW